MVSLTCCARFLGGLHGLLINAFLDFVGVVSWLKNKSFTMLKPIDQNNMIMFVPGDCWCAMFKDSLLSKG